MKKAMLRIALAVMRLVLGITKRTKKMLKKTLPVGTMSVEQLLDSPEYLKELQLQIDMETDHHDTMAREAFSSGQRLQRAPIARLREREVFNAEDMKELYKRMICKQLNGFSSSEREYIKQVCMMAYWRVVQKNKQ